jgi:hypothetical protein
MMLAYLQRYGGKPTMKQIEEAAIRERLAQ